MCSSGIAWVRAGGADYLEETSSVCVGEGCESERARERERERELSTARERERERERESYRRRERERERKRGGERGRLCP